MRSLWQEDGAETQGQLPGGRKAGGSEGMARGSGGRLPAALAALGAGSKSDWGSLLTAYDSKQGE